MGHIRKEELHESLINELEELGNIDLSGKQDKTDESLLTESKDLVGAINELFQSANNGKELIANAIGEPLSSEDTFSAMSNDINGLLSTFKTNMMNNGVTVESGDKFKALIDKIDEAFSGMKQSLVDKLIARGVEASIDEDFNTLVDKIKTVGLISLVPGTSGTYLITHFSKRIGCSGNMSASCEGEINIDTSKFKLDGVAININGGNGINLTYSVTQHRNGALYATHINAEYVASVNNINRTLNVYDVQQGDIFRLSKQTNGSSLNSRYTTITVTSVISL